MPEANQRYDSNKKADRSWHNGNHAGAVHLLTLCLSHTSIITHVASLHNEADVRNREFEQE
jgi:hypothetical protein